MEDTARLPLFLNRRPAVSKHEPYLSHAMLNSSRRPPPGRKYEQKTPLIISVVFHSVLVLLAIFGLPHLMEKHEIVESVPVEIVSNISELTTTNKPPVKTPPKEEKKEEPPPPKKEEAKPPPQKDVPKPPSEEVLKEPPEPKVEPKPEEEKKPEEIAKKVEPKKPEKVEPKKPEKKPKKEEKKKEPQEDDFDKLLKDLDPNTDPPQPDTPPNDQPKMTTPEPSPNISRFSDVLSMSERDALVQQLSGCWNIMAGSANAEDMAVEVRVTVNADRTVRDARIIDVGRYNRDTSYRAAADSALRALKNPRCTPLNLPPEKYSQWQNMIINFDPKDMF